MIKNAIAVLVVGAVLIAGLVFGLKLSNVDVPVGAVVSLDSVDNPYWSIGGVQRYTNTFFIGATSSMPVSVTNPFGATSTLETFNCVVTTNNLGAQQYDLSTSTTIAASSTPPLARFTSVAGVFNFSWGAVATTSAASLATNIIGIDPTNGVSNVIIGPTDKLNFRIATSAPGTYVTYNKGTCKVQIRKL